MARCAVISVDGHAKASRAGYREYLERRHLRAYDDWVEAAVRDGVPDAGNMAPDHPWECQWDSDVRLRDLYAQGVVAEVLFPNGVPFQVNRLSDSGRGADPELTDAGRVAYNRWIVDFCAEAPAQRAGLAVMAFDDVERCVQEIASAKEHGLRGIVLPPLGADDAFFFDPALDPIWAACQEVDFTVCGHGGAGLPVYNPPGFAAILTMAVENAFFSTRAAWQMTVGGVFERFPELRLAFIETTVHAIVSAVTFLDAMFERDDLKWMEFARTMSREPTITRTVGEYFRTNVYFGISPFNEKQLSFDDIVGRNAAGEELPGFHPGADNVMVGLDYPHLESTYPEMMTEVRGLVAHATVTEDDADKILFGNATRVFGFDPMALQPFVDDHGFDLDELAHPVG